jgi:hypothetical protein
VGAGYPTLRHLLYPGQRVYIDIRADMYGDAMMRDYTAMIFGAREWESIFDSCHFDAVLCEADVALVGLLNAVTSASPIVMHITWCW